MKKLFIVLAVASLGFVACNNESKVEETTDSLTNKVEETVAPVKDSLAAGVDSLTKKVEGAVDSLKK